MGICTQSIRIGHPKKDTENDATKTGGERHARVALAGQREVREDICVEAREGLERRVAAPGPPSAPLPSYPHSFSQQTRANAPGSGTSWEAAMRGHSVP